MSLRGEPPQARITVVSQNNKERRDLEKKVLAAAFKSSFASGDTDGAALAHQGMKSIVDIQSYEDDSLVSSEGISSNRYFANEPASSEDESGEGDADTGRRTYVSPPQSIASVGAPTAVSIAPPLVEDTRPPAPATDDAEPSPEAIAEMLAALAAVQPTPPTPLTPSQLIKTQSFYQIFGLNKLSSYEEIHTKFLRLMRRLLRSRYAQHNPISDLREFRQVLRSICVAHDVLRDPLTRTDYDLRQLGMRTQQEQLETPADPGAAIPSRTRLMIGELLECANILDLTELQAALDMHKAEKGVQFGEFLVNSGFLNAEELEAALLGQKLISAGKITLAQFQTAMFRMRDLGSAFFDTLVVEGWIAPSDLLDLSSNVWTEISAGGPATPAMSMQALPLVEASILVEQPACAEATAASECSEEPQSEAKSPSDPSWTPADALAETQGIDKAALLQSLDKED